MACLSCNCIVYGSLNPPNSSSSSSSPPPSKPKSKSRIRPRKSIETKIQQQLSLMEIERAIGAGSYRDSDTPDSEPRDSILKGLLPNSTGSNFETPVEKKLRETGEWVTVTAEGKFQASGKKILMFFLKLVLPIYVMMFLVTSGIVKLPWTTQFLEDMLM